METNTKTEANPEKPLLSMVEGDDVQSFQTNKCVKRRRRSPSFRTAVGYNDQQKPPAFELDQTLPVTTTVKRSSRFRGVSRHRWTGRFEAHLWDKGSWNPTQKKKGKQVYLGAYDEEEAAARAYDLAAIKYWGTSTNINFPISDYEGEVEIMQNVSKEEYLASLRRKSSGFARGMSKYRGVARHHHNGRWEARIGRVFGNKYLYLGTYSTQEEAAHAYDIAAVEYRGINAVTNFELSNYIRWLRPCENPAAGFVHSLGSENEILPNAINKSKEIASSMSNSFTPVMSQKHEIIERKMPLSPFNKASNPTALGLLLRSPMFKELVERTTITSDANVTDQKDAKSQSTGEDDELEFLKARSDHVVVLAVNGERLGVRDAGSSTLCDRVAQESLWNTMQYTA